MAMAKERERCVTGIEGLDNILGGGIPTNNIVLVTGPTGTGKTTLSFEFLARGAAIGENGILITTVEPKSKLLANIPSFVFYDEKTLSKLLSIVQLKDVSDGIGVMHEKADEPMMEKLIVSIEKLLVGAKAKRLVIDTIDTILPDQKDDRLNTYFLARLSEMLHNQNSTAVLVSKAAAAEQGIGSVVDGVIRMNNLDRKGDLLRTMQVTKMKGTAHSRAKYVIDLTSAGVLVTTLLKGGL
jgi:circadian clock protein KaiC